MPRIIRQLTGRVDAACGVGDTGAPRFRHCNVRQVVPEAAAHRPVGPAGLQEALAVAPAGSICQAGAAERHAGSCRALGLLQRAPAG